ncbi:phosphate uptake regulator PhoU [Candidatus Woesearchaeota archaeon]|nr:phosphate uptake regulator PhoU [Candidatus Woesearchaeota archaeon]
METRRIIRFGKNSYVISIPKSWITENKLEKGDSVFIEDDSQELRIMPSEKIKRVEIKKTIIETDNRDLDTIRSEIISAYLMNFNIIELIGSNVSENVSSIKSVLRDLSGLEIMDLTSKRITAHDIVNEDEIDLQNIFRRVDMIIRSMISDAVKTIETDLYENINARDSDVNRLVFLAFRVLRKAISDPQVARKMNMSMLDVMNYWITFSHMESIGDQAKRAARYIRQMTDKNEKSHKEFVKLFSEINDLHISVMKSFYTKDRALAFRVIEDCKKANAKCDKYLIQNATFAAANAVGYVKSMNGLIKHIARLVSTI